MSGMFSGMTPEEIEAMIGKVGMAAAEQEIQDLFAKTYGRPGSMPGSQALIPVLGSEEAWAGLLMVVALHRGEVSRAGLDLAKAIATACTDSVKERMRERGIDL